MKSFLLCNKTIQFIPFPKTFEIPPNKNKISIYSSSPSTFTLHCKQKNEGEEDSFLSTSSPYELLGIHPSCSFADIKKAYRSKVKQFHPDVYKDVGGNSDSMIRRVIQAYETLSKNHQFENADEREGLDPFDDPECEAFDVFVNETLCVGRGCSSSCVKKAPHVFSFVSTGTARVTSQGHGDDYRVQTAVNQCPRNCIHYVTPSQRIILQELLNSILDSPWNSSAAEADILYSLIVKAKFENNRYQKPKKQPN